MIILQNHHNSYSDKLHSFLYHLGFIQKETIKRVKCLVESHQGYHRYYLVQYGWKTLENYLIYFSWNYPHSIAQKEFRKKKIPREGGEGKNRSPLD